MVCYSFPLNDQNVIESLISIACPDNIPDLFPIKLFTKKKGTSTITAKLGINSEPVKKKNIKLSYTTRLQ